MAHKFRYLARCAIEVYLMLDKKQRKQALLEQSRGETGSTTICYFRGKPHVHGWILQR